MNMIVAYTYIPQVALLQPAYTVNEITLPVATNTTISLQRSNVDTNPATRVELNH